MASNRILHESHLALYTTRCRDAEKARLEKRGMPSADVEKVRKRFFLRRTPRQIPNPSELRSAIDAVIAEFGLIAHDEELGPLFTDKVQKELDNLLSHVDKGCLSDPDLVMYYRDINGKLLSLRGSSGLEGFHKHLRRLINGARLSPAVLDAIIIDFIHRWNIKAAVKNGGWVHEPPHTPPPRTPPRTPPPTPSPTPSRTSVRPCHANPLGTLTLAITICSWLRS